MVGTMAKIDDSVKLTSFKGNLYDVMKLILAKRGVSVGRARNPLPHVEDDEMDHVEVVRQHIDDAIAEFTK
ncbi:Dihydrodipicolinate synthetase family protein (fragment) [Latilactobacillus curvatus]|jgi:N-acetylneuraminate lyase